MKKKKETGFKSRYSSLNLGEVLPQGWLKDQLRIQAEGLTGKLEDIWDDVGPESGWLGGNGESWERGPYYCDGLIPLAYLLDDPELKKKAEKWVQWTLNSQDDTGFFGPENNKDWWSRMVMLKVLKNNYEYTKNDEIIEFMLRYFKYQEREIENHNFSLWEDSRATENIYVLLWLYEITAEDFLMDLAKRFMEKTKDWTVYLKDFKYRKPTSVYLNWQELTTITGGEGLEALSAHEKRMGTNKYSTVFEETHVVNVVMALKYPALRYLLYGENDQLEIVKEGMEKLKKYHGTVNGMITGDEHLNGNDPSRGTELCAVVEYMFSLEILFTVFGETKHADLLEKVAYNALPATLDVNIMSHQYDQQANQIMCSVAKRDWYNNLDDSNIFGLEPNFGCCTANMHQGWPKFVKNLCLRTEDDGLYFGIYGPCRVNTTIGKDSIIIEEKTRYPFEDEITFTLELGQKKRFPLYFRIPEWSKGLEFSINDSAISKSSTDKFIKIENEWKNKDKITIKIITAVRVSSWLNNSIGIERGPLVFSLKLNEKWSNISKSEEYPEYEVYTNSKWNYALDLNIKEPGKSFKLNYSRTPERQPFNQANPPITLECYAKIIPEWSMSRNSVDSVLFSPLRSNEKREKVKLIPYGCARLRISEFPYLEG